MPIRLRNKAVLACVAATATLMAGTAASAAEATPASPASSAGVKVEDRYSVDLHSNIRGGKTLKSRVYGTAGQGAYIDIDCWSRGQTVSSGGQRTNVWYEGSVWMGKPMKRYLDGVWIWGGNVNTPKDPPKGLAHC
ncbi:hypothetical protein [Streptomyces griseocarneus]|uniref:hypothetical protein n=1 Tax=Streptomyces griseocarneus TaxID=51201 RepID=UPI00167CB475|nr:hypothetical protein [Streptomyces griseocarneus]MBZ6475105.1 hypothetical protein [Streptomyces griseocarneus]GHG62223.1 hypothetical protein GCM10018779_30750 [Streptomyces griseocarneus]